MKNIKFSLLICFVITIMSSCKEEIPGDDYTVPTTYNFSNASYAGQTYRLSMLEELTAYMKTANTSGITLDGLKLSDMYSNTNSPFADSTLNNSGKNLKDKTYSLDQEMVETYFENLQLASQSTVAGSNGVAGVVVSSSNPSKQYLFDENGIEYTQLIAKSLMGAIFYYQATSEYLENIAADDNTTTTEEATDMEHHFDEAFGYFGVPIDFPTNTTDVRFWGEYCVETDAVLGLNSVIMDAFLAGRAAISASDYDTRDIKIAMIREKWEILVAASAIHELNEAKANFADDAIRNHVCSEAIGFIQSLKYNVNKKITDAEIEEAIAYLGSNLYNVSSADIDNIINLLSAVYGLEDVKDLL
jgi:hypothetical protein